MLATFVQPGPSVHLQDNLKVTSFTPIALFYTDTPPSRDHEGLVQGLITLLYSAASPFPPGTQGKKFSSAKFFSLLPISALCCMPGGQRSAVLGNQ